MQLHPTPFSVPWHSGGDSELSMPLGHLSRHYSTDRSSSVGSMESLENPSNQGYYDSQLSPIDPAIFNNKRDSAYSSFSASSNTSDYTVSLRPEENSSMDSLLQGFGPSCRYAEGRPYSVTSGPGELPCDDGLLKSRTLPSRPGGKIRPSSYSYEEEKCAPPPPPMRKESFRATKIQPGVTDKRCVSAPVDIPSLNCTIETPPHILDVQNGRVCLNGAPENDQDLKKAKLLKEELYHTKHPQKDPCEKTQDSSIEQCQENSQLQTLGRDSSQAAETPDNQPSHLDNHQSKMHRHSAPEKLLASQLCMMELSSDNSEHISRPSSQWTNALHTREELTEDSSDVVAHGKWGGSRCSTPGSVTYSELGEQDEPIDSGQRISTIHNSWECSTSVPGEQTSAPLIDPHVQETCFGTISSASSMDTLLEENQEKGENREDQSEVLKAPQKRHFRTSKSRRRNDRFATNLRNEIQRQKAQLHKCKGSGGLLCDSETLEEEDSSNIYLEEMSSFKPSSVNQHQAQAQNSQNTSFQNYAPIQTRSSCNGSEDVEPSRGNISVSKDDTHGVKSVEISRSVSVQVVEELAPPGKARRWRWTPEHKLQPDTGPNEKKMSGEEKGRSTWSYGTTRGRIGSSGGRSSRGDDCDIPPFADRRKFFEETSKNLSQSVTNLASLTSQRQRPERPGRKNEPSTPEPMESVSNVGCRRFSYQGGVQDVSSVGSLDTRRQLVNVQPESDREREKTLEREQGGEKAQHRKQVIPKEQERIKAWTNEQMQEQEREQDMMRKLQEKESQRVQQVDRDWENNRENTHDLRNVTVLPPLPHDTHLKQPIISQNLTHHNYNSDTSNINPIADIPKPCSAFRPVTSQQYQSNQYYPHHGFQPRSHTPTEVYPVQKLEQTKLNRKFSLTERDYVPCRCDCKQEERSVSWGIQGQRNNRLPAGNNDKEAFMSMSLRNRAMSENDLRIDTQSLHSHVAAASTPRMSSSVLKELDENIVPVDVSKKKKGPPPRPPPPKWEQFHKRRASHHNLFSSQSGFSSQVQAYIHGPPSVTEMARQRSYSLPPREGTESHQQGYQKSPPALVFNHSAFKPVTPLSNKHENNRSQHYDGNSRTGIPSPSTENSTRFSEQSPTDQYRPAVLKPVIHKLKPEWDLTSSHNYTVTNTSRNSSAPSLENGSCAVICSSECFSINNNLQQHLQNHSQQMSISDTPIYNLETSAQCSPPSNAQTLPFETDIDEINESQAAAEEQQKQRDERAGMQCYAQPITVLETDIDTVTVEKTSLTGMRRGQRAFVVDSLLEENCGSVRKELMGELFPQYTQAETGPEGWRGGYPVSGDTLERSSRQGSLALQDSGVSYKSFSNKAQLLHKMPNYSDVKEEDEELNYKKQLMESLRKKLGVLREAQRGLQEDIRANSQLGEEVESLVLAVCKPNEVDKFRMFIGDLDKVTSLLLSLSGRLLRVESALDCLDPESGHRERLPLMEKKKQLLEQLAEAQELKEHVDRREEAVGRVLGRCLTPEQLRDYSHFVKMKAALLVEQRQLDDKIRLGEEQFNGLKESLGMGFCPY